MEPTFHIVIPIFDIAVVSIAIAFLYFVHEIALGLRTLITNTAGGLVIFGICNLIGLGITLTPLTMFEIAIGGIPAAIIVVLLYAGIITVSF